MSELSCVIVDDEFQNRETLEAMIEQIYPPLKILGKADCVLNAVDLIKEKKPNIVFLDIEMPGGAGFKLFDFISDPDFMVIFTTAHAEYAIKAIKFAALDYLLKPLNPNELKLSIDNAIKRLVGKEGKHGAYEFDNRQIDILRENQFAGSDFQRIAVHTSEGIQFLQINDVVRCEADRAYCIFHLVNKNKFVVSKSLKEFEQILEAANFFRVHKSNLINLGHVERYIKGKGGQIVFSNGTYVEVATRRKEPLLNILTDRRYNH